jgi:hypothetical protein
MENDESERYGSNFVMFWGIASTISPPYCGLPRLSHQFPVVVVVVVIGGAVAVVVVVVDVGVDVVEVPQDAKTSDVTMRQVNTIQIAPLFI